MTQRLTSKEPHSSDRLELPAPRINNESIADIAYNACTEHHSNRQFNGCWNPVAQNIAAEQQYYLQGVLPHLQISSENNFTIDTTAGAQKYSGADFLHGLHTQTHSSGNYRVGQHIRGFYEDQPSPPRLYQETLPPSQIYATTDRSIPAFKNSEPDNFQTMLSTLVMELSKLGTKPADIHPAPVLIMNPHQKHIATPPPSHPETPHSTADTPGHGTPEAAPRQDLPSPVVTKTEHSDKLCNVPNVPDAQLTISGAPTITPQKIDEVLKEYNSPAAGLGQYVYDQGIKHGINPAMALAFYVVESKCGTLGLAVKNKSWGNVRGHGPHGYRPFNSIQESVDHWYDLMSDLYLHKFHADKLKTVVAHYSPNSDGNNEAAYVRSVGRMVRKWNTEN